MSAPTEQQDQPVEHDGVVYVPIKLAHPLNKKQAEHVQARTAKAYKVNETIWVTREWGLAIIEDGFGQVDPIDRPSVRRALYLNKRDQPLTMAEIAEASGNSEGSDVDAAVPAKTEGQMSNADGDSKAAAKRATSGGSKSDS